MMDWLVRPLATMFFGGALGGSSGSISLGTKTEEGEVSPGREDTHLHSPSGWIPSPAVPQNRAMKTVRHTAHPTGGPSLTQLSRSIQGGTSWHRGLFCLDNPTQEGTS